MIAQTSSTQATAETFIIRLDECQAELLAAQDYETFASCKRQLEALKGEIEALGYQVERAVIGWKLIQPMAAQPQPATKATTTKKQVTVLARYQVKRNGSVVYRLRNGGGREYQVCLHADGSASCADDTGEMCMAHQYGRSNCYHVVECRRHEEARRAVVA